MPELESAFRSGSPRLPSASSRSRGGPSMSLAAKSVCWLLAAIAFASALAWRDSDTLRVLNVGATVLTLALAGLTIHDERASVFRDRLGELIASLVAAAFAAFTGALAFLFRDLRAPVFQSAWAQHVSRIARVVLIVGGLLLVFGSLLRGADPVFASLTAFPAIDFETIVSHVMLTGVIAWIVLGWTRRPCSNRRISDCRSRRRRGSACSRRRRRSMTLNVLFGAFVLAQLGWLFGGEAVSSGAHRPDGRGIRAARDSFRRVWVVVLVVPLLVATRAALRPGRDVARRHTRAVASGRRTRRRDHRVGDASHAALRPLLRPVDRSPLHARVHGVARRRARLACRDGAARTRARPSSAAPRLRVADARGAERRVARRRSSRA